MEISTPVKILKIEFSQDELSESLKKKASSFLSYSKTFHYSKFIFILQLLLLFVKKASSTPQKLYLLTSA